MFDVPFVLACVGASALTGPSLVALLRGPGRGESAARNLLTRMVDMGALETAREGRTNLYRLGEGSADRFRELQGTGEPPSWEGSFQCLVYTVPESHRTLRDRVMHTAATSGYGLLRPGCFIGVGEKSRRLNLDPADFGGESWLEISTLTPSSLTQAKRMAARAWSLPELAASYAYATTRCEESLAHASGGWDGLRLWKDVYGVCFGAQMADPHLPDELLPAGWPAPTFLVAMGQMNAALGAAVQPFLREVAAAADPDGLNEFDSSAWEGVNASARSAGAG